MCLALSLLFVTDSVMCLTCSDRYLQMCHLCRGSHYGCTGGAIVLTEEQCIAALDDPYIVAVHYNPANSQCPRYTCEDTVYFDDQFGSTRWFGRYTTNPGRVHLIGILLKYIYFNSIYTSKDIYIYIYIYIK